MINLYNFIVIIILLLIIGKKNSGAVGGRNSPFPIDTVHRLYNSLLLPNKLSLILLVVVVVVVVVVAVSVVVVVVVVVVQNGILCLSICFVQIFNFSLNFAQLMKVL